MTISEAQTRPGGPLSKDEREIASMIRERIDGEVATSSLRRAEYASDASNYRIVPEVVAFPKSAEDLIAIADVSRATGTPLHMRGAGTSIAGNAIGRGIVVDTSRHLNRIHSIDPEAKTAKVDPGVIVAQLQNAARPHGLRFGPDPSTWTRCTIGGMIGNNACGSHSLRFGRTADNIVDLDVIDGLGRRYTASDDLSVVPGLQEFTMEQLATIRLEFGRFGRQVSGYALEALLPENGHSLAKTIVGSEGTLGIVLGATVDLVDIPSSPVTIALGYPSMVAAADDVPALLDQRPGAIEGLDARLVDAVRRHHGAEAVAALPEGAGWLLIEMPGEDEVDALDRAHRLVAASAAISSTIIPDAAAARPLWRVREDGVGLASRTQSDEQCWPGFEDAAVPPERLGEYLRDFDRLTEQHGIEGMPYGHFGDGCIHVRLSIPLERDGAAMRAFMLDAGRLVAEYGGSMSGEHGDGRARGELLPLMYSEEALGAFRRLKELFDPRNLLNPEILVDPAPLDADLRRPQALPTPRVRGGFAWAEDAGDFTKAVHRCVGMGKCRADNRGAGGFMCPSYMATKDETHSTRGRARVLQEMTNGGLVKDGWKSAEVAESLDLCLSCKACASDCPAGVDVAAYKSETLYRKYKGRLRPMNHYVLGQLPRWEKLMSAFAPIVNGMFRIGWLRRLMLPLAGVDKRRTIPPISGRTFAKERARAERSGSALAASAPRTGKGRVMVWADSFSNGFTPEIDHDVVRVLEHVGLEVVTPGSPVCCGLTWISTGQLDGARARLSKLMDEFAPAVEAGIPIVGVEPSCTAVLRSDLLELFPDDPRARLIADSTFTLSEVLSGLAPVKPEGSVELPRLDGLEIVVQPHCHQHSVIGFGPDRALLQRLGAQLTQLSGCCGLAGNFGLEKGHYETSVAVAENSLLPALRQAGEDSIFLADGFSCRTQADQLAGREGKHLATLLAERF
ncbi:FAD-binding and (Fe-S)-binding domain-containing protein [Gulosibacter sp. 10]|uniref:FAD-binding and (Fe-S)-binding domain-containing protein n=1 Tax=Gulosibacter sp. 10 TaxID=1255570 RepID=UPI00097E7B42|nr:FAD-binding and (Fe-S)-binding domain-containing protein [Gulosibacter sp. 10]SJM50521.1 Glycolate dehydrogenase, subunit GlcD [Gulosibacter sp. 10]